MSTAEQDLDLARTAWRAKNRAEAELARLRDYRVLSTAMKEDRARWREQVAQAEKTLARILGGAR